MLFLSIFLFLVTSDNDVTLLWREDSKLTWNDFKGEKNTESDAVAVTSSGITFSYVVRKTNSRIVDFKARVEARFYPEKSWVVMELADNYVLAHEQLHFDITELHVRKLRKQISAVRVSQNLDRILNAMHQNMNKELANMQNQYDAETNNSIDKIAQVKWIIYVSEELKKYEAFKSRDN